MVATSFVTNYSLILSWLQRNNCKWKSYDDVSSTYYPQTPPIYVIDKNMFNDAIYLLINQTETKVSVIIIVIMFSYFKLLDNQFLLLSKSVHDWKCWKMKITLSGQWKLISVNWNHLFLVINDKYVLKYVMILSLLHGSSPSI